MINNKDMQSVTINLSDIKDNSNIIKPNYHLNFGKKRIAKIKKNEKKCTTLGSLVKEVYTGGIFKRVFVEDLNFGIPYISAQHMMNANPLGIAKIISKKYTPRQNDMTLEENQILVSCAGTVGNVRLISEDLSGIIGSQDIIRVISDDDKAPYGFIYAFLASKTAYNYIQSFIYGSVVPRIDPKTLAKLPIPIFPKEKQEEIHQLIVDATKLRVEANKLLKEAVDDIEKQYKIEKQKSIYKINISQILSGDKYTKEARFEADYYQPSTALISSQIKNDKYELLGDLCKSVTISNLRARKFVKSGVVLFTGQALGLLKPDNSKQLSRKFTANIKANTTIDGDVLISAFGTLGKIEYCYKNFYTGIFASQQIARIRADNNLIHPGYLYIFFKSKIGQDLIQKYKTGSVIEWANWNNFSSIPIPVPDDKGENTGQIANEIAILNQTAYEKENQAISLIEKEIDLWQN